MSGGIEDRLRKLEMEIELIKQSLKTQTETLVEIKDSIAKNGIIMEKLSNLVDENKENKRRLRDIYEKGTVKCITAHERIDGIEESLNWLKKAAIGMIIAVITQFLGIITYALEHFWR